MIPEDFIDRPVESLQIDRALNGFIIRVGVDANEPDSPPTFVERSFEQLVDRIRNLFEPDPDSAQDGG
jgi:hypothetical protein